MLGLVAVAGSSYEGFSYILIAGGWLSAIVCDCLRLPVIACDCLRLSEVARGYLRLSEVAFESNWLVATADNRKTDMSIPA